MNTTSNKPLRAIWVLTICMVFFTFFSVKTAFAQPDGQKLFRNNCSSCHTITDAKLIGPGLKGVQDRWQNKENLYSWIRNAPEFLKTGDPYANQLFEQYNKSIMTPFPHLKDEEIEAILSYVANPPVKVGDVPKGLPGAEKVTSPTSTILTLFSIAVVLIILLLILIGVKKSLKKVVNEKLSIPEGPELSFLESVRAWIYRNNKLTALIIILLVIGGMKDGWDSLMGIGVYKGYAPEQPINFSHRIHAGDNAIACIYCHSAADESRHAGIPSANVCMNCHKGIQEGTETGSTEIAKIYEALDYDPATGTYGTNTKPISWVRVHNLPDLAYFNHSQHVNVAGVECQTCHGPVEKMEVVAQHTDLTMGWCIDCHRETEVKTAGNGYYEEFHKRLVESGHAYKANPGSVKSDHTKLTVDKIGGIECAKCHY
ncbi:MAG: c-type cytochrome [Bacteroidetes bacterium]|nr:c-type cytochrome [Bacteroidota bacterium]HET6244776.1 c-type cytochrome [Bacteroidia bacterium]